MVPVRLHALILVAASACGGTRAVQREPATGPRYEPVAWGMFRGDATHRGDFSDRRTPAMRVRWTFELGERVDASILIGHDGRVTVVGRNGRLVALDRGDGSVRAERRLDAGVWSSPTQADDVVVLAQQNGVLRGLDADDFRDRWRLRLGAGGISGIALAGGRGFVCAGEELIVFDPASGRALARVGLGAAAFGTPAVDDRAGLVVVATRGGDVLAFDREGAPRWHAVTSPGAHNDSSPVIAGELVLVGSNDHGLHAFEAASGRLRWSARGDAWVVATPAVSRDGVVYSGDDGGVLRALELATGVERWRVQVGDDIGSSPTIVGELVVHGAHDRRLHAHRSDGSGSLPALELGATLFSSPAIDTDGTIFVATHAGRVFAVE